MTANFCSGGARFLKPLHMTAEVSASQYLGGCTFTIEAHGAVQFHIYETSLDPRTTPAPDGYKKTTLHGRRVYRHALDSTGNCRRLVVSAGLIVDIATYPSAISSRAPQLCESADLTAARIVQFMNAGHRLPRIRTAEPSVTGLDLCKVSEAARLSRDPLIGHASFTRNSFGAECRVQGTKLYAYFDATTDTAAALQNYTPHEVAGHRVFQADFSSATACYLSSKQGAITGTARREQIDLYVGAENYKRPVPHLCSHADDLLTGFLNAAGLK